MCVHDQGEAGFALRLLSIVTLGLTGFIGISTWASKNDIAMGIFGLGCAIFGIVAAIDTLRWLRHNRQHKHEHDGAE